MYNLPRFERCHYRRAFSASLAKEPIPRDGSDAPTAATTLYRLPGRRRLNSESEPGPAKQLRNRSVRADPDADGNRKRLSRRRTSRLSRRKNGAASVAVAKSREEKISSNRDRSSSRLLPDRRPAAKNRKGPAQKNAHADDDAESREALDRADRDRKVPTDRTGRVNQSSAPGGAEPRPGAD